MQGIAIVAAASMLVAGPSGANEATCPTVIGAWRPAAGAPPVEAVDVTTAGDLVVVADAAYGSSRLRVLRTPRSGNPVELGRVDLPGNATAVDVAPGLAAVSHATVDWDICVDGGLTLVDLGVPSRPQVLSTLPLAGCVEGVVVHQGVAYVVNDGELVVVDISRPSAPVEVVRYRPELIHAFAAEVSGDVLFVADLYGKVCAADVAEATAPQHLGCTRITDHALLALDVHGDLLAAVARPDPPLPHELVLVDVRWPSQPWRLSVTATAGRTDAVAVAGRLAAVSLGADGGVQLFDVSNPLRPAAVGIDGPKAVPSHHLAISGNRLWAANDVDGVGVYRIDLCHRPRSGPRRTPD